MAVVDFEHQQIEAGEVVAAAGGAPFVGGGTLGVPTAAWFAVFELCGHQRVPQARVPVVPVVALHVEHHLSGVVPVIGVSLIQVG